jgi:hypothetical protein
LLAPREVIEHGTFAFRSYLFVEEVHNFSGARGQTVNLRLGQLARQFLFQHVFI